MNNNTKKSQLCKGVEKFNRDIVRLARIGKFCDKVMGKEQWYQDKYNQDIIDCERDYELLLDEKGEA